MEGWVEDETEGGEDRNKVCTDRQISSRRDKAKARGQNMAMGKIEGTGQREGRAGQWEAGAGHNEEQGQGYADN